MKVDVSIIIPTLNEENYIENTLKSLKNQNYEGKYEIIVVDSKSKDKTVRIAKRYADKTIVTGKKGVATARNIGAAVAKGNILIFVDADTLLLFDTMTKLVNAFKDKNLIGATCSAFPLSSELTDITLYMIYNIFSKASLKTKKPQVAGMCCAYRKDAFDRVNGFDEKTKKFDDFDLSERISKLGKIIFVDDTFVLTSHRRIKAWGRIGAIKKYATFYLKHLLTGNAISKEEYKPIR